MESDPERAFIGHELKGVAYTSGAVTLTFSDGLKLDLAHGYLLDIGWDFRPVFP